MTRSGALARPRAGLPGTACLERSAARAAAHASTACPACPQPRSPARRRRGPASRPPDRAGQPPGHRDLRPRQREQPAQPPNRHVVGILNDAGLGTLLFDLLTPEEELNRANVFDIGLLAGRLAEVTG